MIKIIPHIIKLFSSINVANPLGKLLHTKLSLIQFASHAFSKNDGVILHSNEHNIYKIIMKGVYKR